MKFLNALAWVGLVYSFLALVVPILVMAAENRALALAAQQVYYGQRVPYRLGLLVVSILWLVFGGQ